MLADPFLVEKCWRIEQDEKVRPISTLSEARLIKIWIPDASLQHSKGPFTRSDFKDPVLGFEKWIHVLRRSNFKLPFLLAPFIFQEERRMKPEQVLFSSVFSTLWPL